MYIDSAVINFIGAIIGGAIAGIIGLISALLLEARRRKNEAKSTKTRIIKYLIAELEHNTNIRILNEYVPLTSDAFDESKHTGILLDLREELRQDLSNFYTLLSERNVLLRAHLRREDFQTWVNEVESYHKEIRKDTVPLIKKLKKELEDTNSRKGRMNNPKK